MTQNVAEVNGISRIATAGPVVRNDEAVGSIPTSSTILTLSKQSLSQFSGRPLYLRCTSQPLTSLLLPSQEV